ncbi:MAG: C4-dicarboxylate ABC transporter [Alphaproteobacteria bacterium]|nr:MAG: C4-dicarboxylate ABC transporter [Alphaproteobacteria bacterium]
MASAAITMRCSHPLPPENHIAKVIDQWAAEVETLSEHEIDVDVNGSGSLLPGRDNARAVAAGDIECAFTSNIRWASRVPLMNITLDPFAIGRIRPLEKWPASRAAAMLDDALSDQGVQSIAWLFASAETAITSKGRPLIAPDDFKGVKIQGLGPVADAAMKALRAEPVEMPDGEAQAALDAGRITAGVTDVTSALSYKYYEKQNAATLLPLYSLFFNGYVNPDWYASLSDKNKRAILKAGQKAALWAVQASEIASSAAPTRLAEEGMNIHKATKQEEYALAAIMQPAFLAAFRKATGEAGDKLIRLLGELG